MNEIVDSVWFGTIGIVKVHDKITGEDKFYIGNGFGKDERIDTEYIAAYGMRFNPKMIK